MPELDEYQGVGGPDPRRHRGRNPWPIVIAVLVIAGAIAAYFWWSRRPVPAPASPPVAAEPAPVPAEEPEEPPAPLPPLDASDSAVRMLVGELSSHPQLTQWLVNEDLIRRFVVSVSNVAEGVNPKRHLAFLAPDDDFAAGRNGDRVVVDPASYRRYDLLTEVVTSIDSRGFAELFRRSEPLLDEAYQELGYPEGSFRRTFLRALRRLLRTPRAPRTVQLEPDVASYRFADPTLENLSAAQKQLLRMGPDNQGRIQLKLREIGKAMGFSDAELR